VDNILIDSLIDCTCICWLPQLKTVRADFNYQHILAIWQLVNLCYGEGARVLISVI